MEKYRGLFAFYIPYLLFLFLGALVLWFIGKEELHLWSNQFYCGFCDWFFKIVTFGGDGIFVTIVAFALLLKKIRHALFVGLAGIFTLVIINFLKKVVFVSYLRPVAYFKQFEPEINLRLVPNYDVYSLYSFPSGHTAAGFMLFLSLALIYRKSWLSFIFFLAALFVGLSRIYLSQHFFIDIYFGSFVGVLCCGMAYAVVFNKKLSAHWLDQSLLTLRRKPTKA